MINKKYDEDDFIRQKNDELLEDNWRHKYYL